MRNCTSCNNLIDDYIYYDEEYVKTSERRKKCYSCLPFKKDKKSSEQKKNKRIENKIKRVVALGSRCLICGYDRNLAALHFHHLKPGFKSFEISDPGKKTEFEILEELSKCILICANCHAEEHNPEYSNWQNKKYSIEWNDQFFTNENMNI